MTSEAKDEKPAEKKVLSLGNKLGLKNAGGASGKTNTVEQSFTHGRRRAVAVEVKRKRDGVPGEAAKGDGKTTLPSTTTTTHDGQNIVGLTEQGRARSATIRTLTNEEREARVKVLREAMEEEKIRQQNAPQVSDSAGGFKPGDPVTPRTPLTTDALRQREMDELNQIIELEKQQAAERETKRKEEEDKKKASEGEKKRILPKGLAATRTIDAADEQEEDAARSKRARTAGRAAPSAPAPAPTKRDAGGEKRRGGGKVSLSQIHISGGEVEIVERTRSMASARRMRAKEKRQLNQQDQQKIIRDVIVPEFI
jgi:translation initiation factor IF-2